MHVEGENMDRTSNMDGLQDGYSAIAPKKIPKSGVYVHTVERCV